MDPLSDMLAALIPRGCEAGAFDMGGDWSLRFPPHAGVKCYAVVVGECWLAVDDGPEPARLGRGECFLLPGGAAFRLASDLALTSRPYTDLPREGAIARGDVTGGCLIAGGHFALADIAARTLLDALPSVIHMHAPEDRATLRWALTRMRAELVAARPGASLIAQHLAQIVLTQMLRLHLANGPRAGAGPLAALADRQIGAALGAVHRDPGRHWTLATMAQEAGLSRSGFAIRFRDLVGRPPADYVAHWRMMVATDRLTHGGERVSDVAHALGYRSPGAFAKAFRKQTGRSPRQLMKATRAD